MQPNAKPVAGTRLRVSPRVYARAFGDEIVLLDFRAGEYFGLDTVAADVWRLLEAGETVERVTSAIVERYDVTRETALEDISRLLDDMRGNGLIETT